MHNLTVILRDDRNARDGYEPVLAYDVTVPDLSEETILAAVISRRADDIGANPDEEDAHGGVALASEDISVLFAFSGHLPIVADFRA